MLMSMWPSPKQRCNSLHPAAAAAATAAGALPPLAAAHLQLFLPLSTRSTGCRQHPRVGSTTAPSTCQERRHRRGCAQRQRRPCVAAVDAAPQGGALSGEGTGTPPLRQAQRAAQDCSVGGGQALPQGRVPVRSLEEAVGWVGVGLGWSLIQGDAAWPDGALHGTVPPTCLAPAVPLPAGKCCSGSCGAVPAASEQLLAASEQPSTSQTATCLCFICFPCSLAPCSPSCTALSSLF